MKCFCKGNTYCEKCKSSFFEVNTLEPKPWRRMFARYIDSILYGIIFTIFLVALIAICLICEPNMSPAVTNNGFILMTLFAICSLFIESVILKIFGTTLGKKALGIKLIHKSKSKPPISVYFKRTAGVLLMGKALNIPLLWIYAYYVSYKKLKKNHTTYWDRENEFDVIYRKKWNKNFFWKSMKIILPILFLIITFIAYSIYRYDNYINNYKQQLSHHKIY